jgi:hypothetical protein
MSVQCIQCGHENNSQYRFCGMCGASLHPILPPVEEPPRERAPRSVSGPSFLGLGDEPPRRNLDYLLEDEPPSSRGRVFLALLLLVLIAVFLVWRWRRDGYPWAGAISGKSLSSAPAASPSTGADTSAEPPAPTTPAEPPVTTSGADHPPTTPETPATETIDIGPSQSGAPSKAAGSAAPPSKTPETQTPANPAPGATDEAPPQPTDRSASDDSAAKPDDASVPAAKPTPAKSVGTPSPKLSGTKDQPANSLPTNEDKLVSDGERYLYGTGVPQSCDRARKNLFTAASNAKAQSLLGAMYATGHCVNRDLPSAYRWFAKALHQEPGNERVARDLEVLWKQMTPAERQAAVRGEQ